MLEVPVPSENNIEDVDFFAVRDVWFAICKECEKRNNCVVSTCSKFKIKKEKRIEELKAEIQLGNKDW